MKPYIAAYKAGASTPTVQQDQLVYWYRPTPKSTVCTGDPVGPSDGYQLLSDSIFITTMLTKPATLIVTSGTRSPIAIDVPAGIVTSNVTMGVGGQFFYLKRNGATILSGLGGRVVTDTCKYYNFNAYVGSFDTTNSIGPAPSVASTQGGVSMTSTKASQTTTSSRSTTKPSSTQATTTKPTTSKTTSKAPSAPTSSKTTARSSSTTKKVSTTSKTPVKTTTTSKKVSTTKAATTTKRITTTKKTTTTTKQPTTTTKKTTTKARKARHPKTTSSLAPRPTSSSSRVCSAGTGQGNYVGLCAFACSFGYCPPGPCTCTEYVSASAARQVPSDTGKRGRPAPGLDDSYLGLCAFACARDYCPPTACFYG